MHHKMCRGLGDVRFTPEVVVIDLTEAPYQLGRKVSLCLLFAARNCEMLPANGAKFGTK